jgi:hypothetical protein
MSASASSSAAKPAEEPRISDEEVDKLTEEMFKSVSLADEKLVPLKEDDFLLSGSDLDRIKEAKTKLSDYRQLFEAAERRMSEVTKWSQIARDTMYLVSLGGQPEAMLQLKQKRMEAQQNLDMHSSEYLNAVNRLATAFNAFGRSVGNELVVATTELQNAYSNGTPFTHSSNSPLLDKEDQQNVVRWVVKSFNGKVLQKECMEFKYAASKGGFFSSISNVIRYLQSRAIDIPSSFTSKYQCLLFDDSLVKPPQDSSRANKKTTEQPREIVN